MHCFYSLTLWTSESGWADPLSPTWHFQTLEAAKAFAQDLSDAGTAILCDGDYRWFSDLEWSEFRDWGSDYLKSTEGRFWDHNGRQTGEHGYFRISKHSFQG